MADENEEKKARTKTSWEPKKTVTTDVKKGEGPPIPWEPETSVMKVLEESYPPKKTKKTES